MRERSLSSPTWNNANTLIATNGNVNFGGTFTLANIGSFTRTGSGAVTITGTLNNAGTTLALDSGVTTTSTAGTTTSAPGTWQFIGTINGGTVTTAGSAQLIAITDGQILTGGTLNGLTLGGTMFWTSPPPR